MPRSNKVFQVKKPQDEAVDMAEMPFWKSSTRNVNRYRAYVKVVRVWVPDDTNAAQGTPRWWVSHSQWMLASLVTFTGSVYFGRVAHWEASSTSRI